MRMTKGRGGFTLFEVGICLVLVSLSILTLVLCLPAGVKVQQHARFRLYAAAKAMDMAEQILTTVNAASLQLSAPGGSKNAFMPEAKLPWDSQAAYRAFAPDIDARLATMRGGILPLPTEIAYRIDSQGDEIKRLLDQGAQLYYGSPLPTHGLKAETSFEVKPPSEAIRLVFAVTGHPQQNAITRFPWKDWPYYAPYPSPPMTGYFDRSAGPWEALDDPDCRWVWTHDFGEWDGTGMYALHNSTRRSGFEAYCAIYGGPDHSSAYSGTDRGPDGIASTGDEISESGGLLQYRSRQINFGEAPWLAAKHYFALALWYAYAKGVPPAFILGTASSADVEAFGDDPGVVRAMRYLAHAGICMTRQYALDPTPALAARSEWRFSSPGQRSMSVNLEAWPPLQGLRDGVAIPGDEAASFGGTAAPRPLDLADLFDGDPAGAGALPGVAISTLAPAPATHPDPILAGHFYLTHDMIVNYHETSLRLAMRWAARRPYDWSVPRPINRAIMMDFPLLQFDCFPTATYPTFTGTITGTASDPNIAGGAVSAAMWRPIAAQPVVNQGHSAHRWQVGDYTADVASASPSSTDIWGDPAHFTLTAPFEARERCRQIVFWMVDWTGFSDWETAASAPVDASKYPRLTPGLLGENLNSSFTSQYMGRLGTTYGNPTVAFYDRFQPLMRNPEKTFLFKRNVSTWDTGANIRTWTMGLELHGSGQTDAVTAGETDNDRWDWGYRAPGTAASGRPSDSNPMAVFSGLYGADRNWNQILDRGPLPRSARLRAVEVARFNLYDPRLEISQR